MEILGEFPVVFHIGFHKTGTTWLQNSYFADGDSFNLLSDAARPWDDPILRQLIATSNADFNRETLEHLIQLKYKKNKLNIISAERLSGHPISGGHDAQQIAERIHSRPAKDRIVITTRQVNSFCGSVYKQMIREGYCGTANTFFLGGHWKTLGTTKDYFLQEKTITFYKNKFGDENVLVLSFEEFKKDKLSYIKKLNDFLGIQINDSSFMEGEKLINPSFSNRRIRALRILNRVRKTELNPFPLIHIGSTTAIGLSRIFAVFFSNTELTSQHVLREFIGRSLQRE